MATYNGTNGDDVINATSGSNTINAGNGNNRVTTTGNGTQKVTAGTGNDTITTGDGNDTINAGAGNNVINAGGGKNDVTTLGGNDTITTGSGDDDIDAGDGRNVIDAGNGQNSVTTGSGDDQIRTGTGNDQIYAGEGHNVINASDGTNIVTAGAGNDTITTGLGNDQISAGNGNNVIDAGAGNNSVSAGTGDDWIRTGAGNDVINAGDGRNDIDAGNGINTVNTGRGDDTIVTGTGKDTINAGDGRNIIDAGAGDNRVTSGSGADDITTGNDDDTINAGDGINVIRAGDGDNDITSGSGADTITSGSGNDAIYAGDGANVINAGNGHNAVYGGSGNDQITTGSGNDAIYAGDGNNIVNAGDGINAIYTGSGNDRVIGGSGTDLVYTGAGDDFVDLGGGSDLVYLDSGNDTYRYVMSQHTNTIDVAWGGSGTDTLQLVLTDAQARDSRVISDIQRFNTDSDGSGLWGWIFGFQFTAFNLSVRDFENIDVIAPVDAINDAATVGEDSQVTVNVLANDLDLGEANNSQLRVISYDAAGVPGTLMLANNQFTFVPGAAYQYLAAGQSTTVSFTYTIGDNEGYTDTATVTLTIVGSNDGPIAVADVAAITENQAVTVDVLANDTDVDAGAVLTLVSAGAPSGKGLATVVNNKLVFTPGTAFDHLAAGVTETVVVSYTMKDDKGATSTSTLTVTVTGTNDGPIAVADVAAGTENQTLTINVLVNDTDVDDGTVFTLTSATAPAGKGTASVVNNQLVFTPGTAFDHLAAGVTETVTLTYAMKDQFGATSNSTVTLTITGTNDGPVAVADVAAGTENQTLTVDVLANDTDLDDNHVYTLTGVAAPAGKGAATIVGNKLVFTPGTAFDHLAAGVTETVVVTYTMKDDQGATSTSTVTLTITGTNDGPCAIADVAAGTENQILTIDVLANDTDVDDNHVFTLTAVSAPAGKGGATIVGNQLVFAPGTSFDHLAAGATETVVLSYTMKDDQGAVSTSTVTVTITGANDGPIAVADAAATTENSAITVDVLANDTDLDDGHVFTLTAATAPAGKGDASVVNDQLVFTPGTDFDHLAAGAIEVVTVSYAMKDDQGAVSTSTLTVTITGTNDAPVAVADVAATTENGAITVDVLANDTDLDDGHVFTLTAATAPAGKGVASVVNNQLAFTPGTDFDHLAAGATEVVTVSYAMKDDQGAVSTSTLTITITGTNDAPVAVADVAAAIEDGAIVTGSVATNDSDVDDGATHSFALDAPVAGLTLAANGSYSFDPSSAAYQALAAGELLNVVAHYTITDDQGATAQATLTIALTGTNDAPVVTSAASDAAGAVRESGTNDAATPSVAGQLASSDVDHNATAAWSGSANGTYGSFAVNAAGAWAYTLDNTRTSTDALAAGETVTETFLTTVTDDQGATATQTVTITVTGTNDAPIAVADVAAGTENQVLTIDVLANDTDLDDGHVFTLTAATAPSGKGIASVANNQLVFTPGTDFDHLAAGAVEVITLSYTMQDDQGASSTSTVTVTITGTNDAPVAVADVAATTENAAITVDVLANDTDVDDGHVFTLTSATAPNGKGAATVVGNKLVFTPGIDFDHLAAGATEVVTVSYAMTDEHGAESVSTLSITITGTNDAPIAVADVAAGTENQTLTINVLANDTDVDDNHVFTLTGVVAPEGKGLAAVVNNRVVFAPGTDFDHLAAGVTETVTLTYAMKDEFGATSASTVTITVTGTNDAPVAGFDDAATTENAAIAIDVLANDTDVDDGHVLTVTGALVQPGQGSIAVVANQLVFTPGTAFDHLAAGDTATVIVFYSIKDDKGAQSAATVTITVTGTNDAPIAVADAAAGTENQVLTVNVLANDTDIDDNHAFTLTAAAAPAGKGTATVVGNQLVFTPGTAFDHLAAGATETVVLTYTMQDEHGAASSSTVTVTITGTNDAPVAVADVAAVTEDTIVSGTVAANDSDVDDSATRSFTLNAPVAGLTFNADGSYSFDASDAAYQNLAQGATRVVTASYTVTDDLGATAASTLTITITGTNDAPVAFADVAAVLEDSSVSGNVRTNDVDVDTGAALTYTLNAPVAGLTLNANGTYSFNAANAAYQALALNEVQVVTAGYTVTDQFGATSQSTLTVTVTGRNDAPVAVVDTASAIEDGAIVTGNVGTNDSDVDHGAVLTYSTVTAVAGLTINTDGSYSFDPSNAAYQNLGAGATRVVSATYRVTDQNGASATANLNITVTGTNDAPVVGNVTLLANRLGNGGFDATPNFAGWTVNNGSTGTVGGFTSTTTIDRTGTIIPGDSAVAVLNYSATTSSFGTGYGPSIKSNAFAGNAGDTVSFTYKLSAGGDQAVGRAYIRDAVTGAIVQTIFNYQVPFVGTTGVQTVNVVLATSGSYTIDFQVGSYDATGGTAIGARLDIGFAGILANGISENEAFTFSNGRSLLLANSTDIDVGDTLTVAAFTTTSAMGASVTLAADGSLVVDPRGSLQIQALKQGESAVDSFTFTVADGKGGFTTGTASITMTGANDAPIANADTASTTENQAVTVNALANDTDVDHGAVLTLVSAGVTPGKGTVSVVANQIVFTPGTAFDHLAAGVSETVIVTYVMKDEFGATSTSTATITVIGTNDAPIAVADFAAGTENQTISVNVIANDTDLDDGAVLTLAAASAPAGKGVASVSGNSLVFTPGTDFDHLAAGATEAVAVSYTVRDDQGAETLSTITVTITGTNDAPIVTSNAAAASGAVVEAGALNNGGTASATGTLTSSDVDDGATATWSGNAAGVYGSFGINAAGVWTYTLDNNAAATQALAEGQIVTETFTTTISDGLGGTATQLVTIQVTGAIDNRAPSAAAVSAAGGEDAAIINGTFLGTDPDAGDTLSYEIVSQPALGTVTNNGNGTFAFQPGAAFQSLAAGETSVQTFTYRTLDQLGATSAPATVTVTITGSNDAPVITSTSAAATGALIEAGHLDDGTVVAGVATASGTLTSSDVDTGATSTWSVVNSGNGAYGSLAITSAGVWTYTLLNSLAATQALNEGQTGTESFTVRVSDGLGGTADQIITLNVTGTNDRPVLTADVKSATEDGGVVTGSVKINDVDVDAGAVLTYTLNAPIAGLTLNADGSYSFNPGNTAYQALAAGATQNVFANYTATDQFGAAATSTLTITVTGTNDAPIAVADTKAATEDTTVTGSVATNDSDVDSGAVLSYALNAPIAGLTLNSNGSYSFNAGNSAYQHLALGATQLVTANYTVTDDKGASATSTLTITVTGTNDAPVAVADTSNGGVGTGGGSGGATPAGDEFIVNAPGYSDDQQPSVAKLAGGGFVVTWSNYDYNGGYQTIQAQLFDSAGNRVGSQMTYTATNYNQTYAYEPQVSALSGGGYVIAWSHYEQNVGRTVVHSQTYNSAGVATGTETATEFATNGQGQSYQPVVAALTGGGFAVSMYSYDPSGVSGDTEGVGVRVFNSVGQSVTAMALANTTTTYGQYDPTITGLSDGGFVVAWRDDSDQAIGGQNFIDVRFQRFDAAGNKVGIETVANTTTIGYQYQEAVAALAGGGFVVTWYDELYNSSTGSYGQDIHGQLFSATGVKVGGEFTVNTTTAEYQGEPAVVGLPGGGFVVAWVDNSNYAVGNYTDGQDIRAQVFDATGAKVGSEFVVASNPADSEYAPSISAGADGTFVIAWSGYDPVLGDGTGTTVFARLFSVGTSGNENSPVTIDVLANDTDVDDGAVLTLTNVSVAANQGSASIVGNKLVFNPGTDFDHLAAGATQTVTVVYTMQDQYGATSTSVATVTLTGINDAPVAVADTKAAIEDTTVTGSVATNDSDVDDGAVLTYSLNAPVAGLTLNSNGTYSFDAGNAAYQSMVAGETRAITANYTVVDQAGATATSTLTITVTGTNDAPVAVADTRAVSEDSNVTGSVATNDSDADAGAILTYSLNAPVTGLTFNSNGSYSFNASNAAYQSLAQGQTQAVTANYTVTDDKGATATSTLTITITGTNDLPVVTSTAAAATGTVTEAGNLDSGVTVAGVATATGTLTASDVDAGSTRTWSTTTPSGSYGTFAINAAGVWTYTLNNTSTATQGLKEGQSVTDTFTARVTDNNGGVALQTVTVTVNGTNDAPTLTGVATPLTFSENTVNATPQFLDTSVTFADADANMANGRLVVTGLLTEDRVALAANGGITISGTTVSHQGVAIGTLSGGSGATFTVQFNASATVASTQALVQALTYADVSDTPTAARTLIVNVFDGAGGQLAPTYAEQTGANNPFDSYATQRSAASFADVDNDGDQDMIVGSASNGLSVFRNNGGGSYSQLVGAANPFASIGAGNLTTTAWADLNGDGRADMVLGADNVALRTFVQNANGTFTEATGAANPFNGINGGYDAAPTFLDYDGDGDKDMVLGNYGGDFRTFRNNGNGTFTELGGAANPFNGLNVGDSHSKPAGVDFDNDGDMDMVAGSRFSGLVSFRNNGDGTFTKLSAADNPYASVSLGQISAPAFTDLNGDGIADAVFGSDVGTLRTFTSLNGVAVVVNVTAQHDAPAGTNGSATLIEDGSYTMSAADFGFTDSDGNSLSGVKFTTLPAAGTLKLNGVNLTAGQTVTAANITAGQLSFVPAANGAGTGYASFTFQVQDNGGTANGGADLDPTANTFTFNVTLVNDAPVGVDRTITAIEDTALVLTTANFAFTDIEGNASAAVKITTLPAAGTLALLGVAVTAGQIVSAADIAAGRLTFTAAVNANGTGYSNFTFQVQDNGGTANGGVDTDQSPNTMTINVTAVNDAPTDVSLATNTAPENVPSVTVGLLSAADVDAGDTFTYSIRPGLDGSLFTVVGNELRVGGSGLDYEQATSRQVTIRATDAAGGFFDRTFTIQVVDSNEFTLTTGNDVFNAGNTNDQVLANSLTLAAGDQINTGGGADELLLFGNGTFNLASMTAYSGVETVRLINLTANTAVLSLKAGVQNDVIATGTGATTTTLNNLASTFTGSDGVDTVTAGTGNVVINTGANNDTVTTGSGTATVDTGTGNDVVNLSTGAATVVTGQGDDTVYLGAGLADVNAGTNNDSIFIDRNGFNAASDVDGGQGSDTLVVEGVRDLTGNTLVNLESLNVNGTNGGATLTAAQLTQFTTINGSVTARVTVADATVDLIGKSISNVNFYSTNATGTLFQVSNAAAALQMFGGNGNDTVQVIGAALSADQRDILFAVSSIETLIDSSGTYNAPAATPGTIKLTTGADTIPAGSPADVTVNATSNTLTTNDTLDGGATGTDVLAIYGTGTFNMNSYNVSGFEEFRLINNTTAAVSFTMKTGQTGLVNSTGTGNSTIQLANGATTVTTGNGGDTIYGSTGAATISTGAGGDTIFGGTGLMTVDAGNDNDTVYADYFGWNAGSSFNGGQGYDYLRLYTGARDLSATAVTNFEYVQITGDVKMTATQAQQFQQFEGQGYRINVAEAAVDLTNKSGNTGFGSLNATGTSFKVNSVAMAFQVLGGAGTADTLDAATITLTAAQRQAIFNGSLLETIIDATGTYAAPALAAGTIKLTSGNDTLPALPDSLTVLANLYTFNSGDSLNAGATGTDTLALYGTGQINLATPTVLSGFEAITLENNTNTQAVVYLRSGMGASFTSVGTGGVQLMTSDTAVTVTLGSGNDLVQFGSGAVTLDMGAGSDTVYGANALANINMGAGNDTAYLDISGFNGASAFNGGADFDYLYVYNSHDMTTNSVSNFEYLYVNSSSATVKVSNAQLVQFQYVQGGTGSKITTGDATFDLTNKIVGGVAFLSDNATGTLFKVSNSAVAFLVTGGAGQDGVEAVGFTFTVDQRTALLNGASIEYVVEGNTINGGSGANTLVGGVTANTIYGNGGNDTIDGGAGADVLTGGDGNDTFVFTAGQANGDRIVDFSGNGVAAGDSLRFEGYGAGATFTQVDATHWQVNYNGGASHDVITFDNAASIDAADYSFVAGAGAQSLSAGLPDENMMLVSVASLDDGETSGGTDDAVAGQVSDQSAGGAMIEENLALISISTLVGNGDGTEASQGSASLSSQPTGDVAAGTDLGRPTIDGSRIASASGADTLQGTGGDDVFVFHAGTADGDHVLDFSGVASTGGDKIEFIGFSADAIFTQVDETHWQIDYNAGAQHEVITFENAAPINTQDFAFV